MAVAVHRLNARLACVFVSMERRASVFRPPIPLLWAGVAHAVTQVVTALLTLTSYESGIDSHDGRCPFW